MNWACVGRVTIKTQLIWRTFGRPGCGQTRF